jgi:hypothetical protein
MLAPRRPAVRTPTSGVLVEALFALVTLSVATLSAWTIARGRPAEPPKPEAKE